jgi:hypothetical protein
MKTEKMSVSNSWKTRNQETTSEPDGIALLIQRAMNAHNQSNTDFTADKAINVKGEMQYVVDFLLEHSSNLFHMNWLAICYQRNQIARNIRALAEIDASVTAVYS